MELKKILEGTEYKVLKGSIDIEINEIQYDSRKVQKGDMFFCIEGYSQTRGERKKKKKG